MTKLNYSFTDVELLNTALTHSSFVRGDNRIYPNNEWGYGILDLYNSFEQMRLQ